MKAVQIPHYTIREATTDDVEAIRRMQAQSWRDTYQNDELGVTREWLEEETESWLTPEALKISRERQSHAFSDPSQFYRVGLLNQEIVGLLHVSTKDNGSRHLWGLYTAKHTHGSGLAQQLMDLALQWIGNNEANLDVATYNNRAKAFYSKYGFETVESTVEPFKGRIPIVTMIRKGEKI